jgi:ATP-dependent RNA helicase RhlE
MSFTQLGLHPLILKAVRSVGYAEPTPIQRRAIPVINEGHDLIGAAQTGTGKTAAFILPILSRLIDGPRRLRALVITPTRELAAQVTANGQAYAKYARLTVGCVFGGVPIGPQERMLRHEGVDLLVATPGRLLDLNSRQSVSLDDVEVLVLDEADRMVDMGFAPDMKRILRLLPTDRQTLLFSATMPKELNEVARDAMVDPVRVDLAPPSRPAAGITQAIYPVPRALKIDLLDELLSRIEIKSVIVFTRTKRGADRVSRQLSKRGHPTAAIHGDRTQGQRERALLDLKRGRVKILVATDIASRGIDVRSITHVINFDVPHTPDDYIHRIGRTGRVDAVGDAFTLMSPEEKPELAAIERALGRSVPRVLLPDFDYHMRPSELGQAVKGEAPERHREPRGHGRGAPPARGHAPARGGAPRARNGSAVTSERRPEVATGSAPDSSHGRGPRRAAPTDRRGRGRW